MQNEKENFIFGNLWAEGLVVLKEQRIIYINDAITSKLAVGFNLSILEMEKEDSESDITVYINSPGGDVTAGLSIIDTMSTISCDVRTICVGMAASMGALILMCGTKGKREILPHSYVLIHQILAGLGNGLMQASDIEIFSATLSKRKRALSELIAECTGQPIEKVIQDCERDYTLCSSEALAYGIVDKIIEKHK
jgi:ATP-dependent Clp protease, protease subunit